MEDREFKLKYKRKFGFKVKDGWKDLGQVDIDGKNQVKIHTFCNKLVNIGITDDGLIFRYCPRCKVITAIGDKGAD